MGKSWYRPHAGRSWQLASAGAATLLACSLTACSSSHAASPSAHGGTASSGGASTVPSPSSAVPSSSSTSVPLTQSPADPDGDEASPSSGAEGIVSGEGPPCPLTGPETVLKFFGAKTVSFVAKTGPTGKPLCLFTVKGANVGGATGTVSMTVDSSSSAKAFAATQRAAKGAADLPGVGDTAFYVNDTGTAEFLKGNSAVIVQATFSLAAGTRYAATIRTDVVSVAKVVAAQI